MEYYLQLLPKIDQFPLIVAFLPDNKKLTGTPKFQKGVKSCSFARKLTQQ